MTILTTIFLYSLSIIAGAVLVVYALSIKPRTREQPTGAHDLDVSPDSSLPINAGLILLPEEDSSEKQQA